MESTTESIEVHRGTRRKFDRRGHFEESFEGGDDANKRLRYELYRQYSRRIVDEHDRLRRETFAKCLDKIFEHLHSSNRTARINNDLVDIVGVMFLDSAVYAADNFFDTMLEDKRIIDDRRLRIARLRTGDAYSSPESVIEDFTKQIEDGGGDDESMIGGGFQSLLLRYFHVDVNERYRLLLIMDDVLSFDVRVLEDFLLVVAQYKSFGLPISVVAGFPQANSVASIFSVVLMRKCVFDFVNVSMTQVLGSLLHFIARPMEFPFRLSPKVMQLLIDTAVHNGMTTDEVAAVMKAMLLEHFRSKENSAYCLDSGELRSRAIRIDEKALAKKTTSMTTATPSKETRKRRQSRNDGGSHDRADDAEESRFENHRSIIMAVDEFRSVNLCGWKLFNWIRRMDRGSEYSDVNILQTIALSADEKEFFGNGYVQYLLSIISNFETTDQATKFVHDCATIIDEMKCISNVLTDLRGKLASMRRDLASLDELQEKENREHQQRMEMESSKCQPQRHGYSNRSSKLTQLQAGIETKKVSKPVDLFGKKKSELTHLLESFFLVAFAPPSKDAVAIAYFDDSDFLRRIISPSTRRVVQEALTDPNHYDYGARFDIYDQSGPNIDLAQWFDAFKTARSDQINEENADEIEELEARFYKMLSSMEFVGLISKGKKKGVATKLCWTAGLVQ